MTTMAKAPYEQRAEEERRKYEQAMKDYNMTGGMKKPRLDDPVMSAPPISAAAAVPAQPQQQSHQPPAVPQQPAVSTYQLPPLQLNPLPAQQQAMTMPNPAQIMALQHQDGGASAEGKDSDESSYSGEDGSGESGDESDDE